MTRRTLSLYHDHNSRRCELYRELSFQILGGAARETRGGVWS